MQKYIRSRHSCLRQNFLSFSLYDYVKQVISWAGAIFDYRAIIMSPTIGVFSADPVGVGMGSSVVSCLHSISLMSGWILAKLTQIYHWVGKND